MLFRFTETFAKPGTAATGVVDVEEVPCFLTGTTSRPHSSTAFWTENIDTVIYLFWSDKVLCSTGSLLSMR